MTIEVLSYLRCPVCGSDLESDNTSVNCSLGHEFPIRRGVPDLVQPTCAAAAVSDTFSVQWSRYEYGQDHTWSRSLDDRVDGFLAHLGIDSEWLRDKAILDAGCGNGELTNEVALRFRPRMFGTDISESVYRAHQQFGANVSFFRSNLSDSVLRPERFDAIYCGGVLHHTPDTRHALGQLAPAVKPAGRIYVWLYWKIPTLVYRAKTALRRFVAPLPPRAQQPIVSVFTAASWIRHGGRTGWRDHRLVQHDFWTPRYRWEHSPDEVIGWLHDLGFSDVSLQSQARDGFGLLAVR